MFLLVCQIWQLKTSKTLYMTKLYHKNKFVSIKATSIVALAFEAKNKTKYKQFFGVVFIPYVFKLEWNKSTMLLSW
jgi:hypothetical protein